MRPNPSRVRAFKNCLGTIWSVSTFTRSRGTTTPECVVKGCIIFGRSQGVSPGPRSFVALLDRFHREFAHIHEVAGNRGCSGHHRADQVRAAVATLTALEIAV